ncbi:MAG: acyl-CoA dehydrogenase family protein, partial [Bdellovibrionales bacterium]|nr:acyl-CoA dehydrogenase family protein [Bdellovibrionales bacterium]
MPFLVWTIAIFAVLLGFSAPFWLTLTFAVVAVIFNVRPLRKSMVSGALLKAMKPIMPKISETERTALEAGVVWREADLFSGKPDMQKLMDEPYPELTVEEQAFIDGPVNRLCELIDDWKVWKERTLSDEAMDYIKKEKFLGMIIPKEYGGLGFSALCNSEVVQKLSSHSITAGITVMVPNSLGPAELLIHYGTQAQKDRYLRKLATGEEIPCFGLTEPMAGSDAGAITSTGVLYKGDDGEVYLKLNWQKRWITLSPISTLIGLAFRLKDPENILGKGVDVGITCALIPSHTPGVW